MPYLIGTRQSCGLVGDRFKRLRAKAVCSPLTELRKMTFSKVTIVALPTFCAVTFSYPASKSFSIIFCSNAGEDWPAAIPAGTRNQSILAQHGENAVQIAFKAAELVWENQSHTRPVRPKDDGFGLEQLILFQRPLQKKCSKSNMRLHISRFIDLVFVVSG